MATEGRRHPRPERAHRSSRPSHRLRAAALTLPALLALHAGALAAPAPEERPDQALKRVEQEIEADAARRRFLDRQSDALEAELEALRAQLVTLADQARAQEGELAELEDTLRALQEEEGERATRLDAERQQIAHLLAGLQRLSRVPPEVAIARPGGPVDTLRSALMLRDAVPVLRSRADALASALQRLAEVRERLVEQRSRAETARTALAARQTEIARLVARREAMSRETEQERESVARRMAGLAAQAGDLRQLLERIEAERRATVEAAARREAERLEAERQEARRQEAARREAERQEAARQQAEAAEKRAAAETRQLEERKAEEKKAAAAAAQAREADANPPRKDAAKEVASLPRASDLPPTSIPSLGDGLRQPVGGRVVTRYGEADRYGAPSRGLTIQARAGTPVVAPSAGTVVFAGTFRSYGQILIVEHGNGYHSLIAGLGRIDTAVGKKVAAGEPVGLTPGAEVGSPELYYELRRHGQPINPQRGVGAPEGKGQG